LNRLEQYGWSAHFEAGLEQLGAGSGEPARIVAEHKSVYRVQTAERERTAALAGRLRREAAGEEGRPAVGDWILLLAPPGEGRALIHAVLPRRSALARKAAGRRTSPQVVAANLDTVFLVSSLNRDLNPRRIERYLTAIYEGGASPVIVLSKADLCDDVEGRRAEVEGAAVGVPVCALSTRTGEGMESLEPHLRPGRTVALVGSSGVGKSTLINHLLGEEVLAVREIREDDDRGRHATTHRQLLLLPQGALVIDTPGMRELGLADGEAGLRDAFAEIEELVGGCRFGDCRHESEPGCAVLRALEEGSLDPDRLESYRKLQRELAFQARQDDVRLRLAEQRRWKRITLDYRRRSRSDEP